MSNDLQPITQRLDTLIKLVASSFLSGKKQQEKIELLSRVGMAPKEIAELIGTTPNTVRVALVAIKKSNKKRGAQNGKVKKQSTS
jgi:DNA-binding NarL/FixJ family response regulator